MRLRKALGEMLQSRSFRRLHSPTVEISSIDISVVNRVLRSRFNRDSITISGDRDRKSLTRDHDYSIQPPIYLYRTDIQQGCRLLAAINSPHGPPSAAGFTVYKHRPRWLL